MKQLFCLHTDCSSPLGTADEIVTGLCSRHLEQIRSGDYITGICWQCGSITALQHKNDQRKFPVSDKFIFARGCVRCTGIEHEGIMWMTIRKDSKPESAISPTGEIVPISGESKVAQQAIVGESPTESKIIKEESRRKKLPNPFAASDEGK